LKQSQTNTHSCASFRRFCLRFLNPVMKSLCGHNGSRTCCSWCCVKSHASNAAHVACTKCDCPLTCAWLGQTPPPLPCYVCPSSLHGLHAQPPPFVFCGELGRHALWSLLYNCNKKYKCKGKPTSNGEGKSENVRQANIERRRSSSQQSHTHRHTHTHTRTHAHTCAHAHKHTRMCTHAHARAYACRSSS